MHNSNGYYRSIHRSSLRPEYGRVRRHSFGIGLAIFWACYLAAMAYGGYWLGNQLLHRLP